MFDLHRARRALRLDFRRGLCDPRTPLPYARVPRPRGDRRSSRLRPGTGRGGLPGGPASWASVSHLHRRPPLGSWTALWLAVSLAVPLDRSTSTHPTTAAGVRGRRPDTSRQEGVASVEVPEAQAVGPQRAAVVSVADPPLLPLPRPPLRHVGARPSASVARSTAPSRLAASSSWRAQARPRIQRGSCESAPWRLRSKCGRPLHWLRQAPLCRYGPT